MGSSDALSGAVALGTAGSAALALFERWMLPEWRDARLFELPAWARHLELEFDAADDDFDADDAADAWSLELSGPAWRAAAPARR
jgi:hypothetical protein